MPQCISHPVIRPNLWLALSRLLCLELGIFLGGTGLHAEDDPVPAPAAKEQEKTTPAELTPEAQLVADELKATLPADSEARAMLDAILAGSRLGAGEGWFKMALSQTRFSWERISQQYDSDSDGKIDKAEFSGLDDDFMRLDRDGDHAVTAIDLDWSEHSLTPTPGLMLFFQADRDSNGKLTREEFADLFTSLDVDQQGFLAIDELRHEFEVPTQRRREERPDAPTPSKLVLGLQRQEIGSLQPGPKLDEPAPDFTLNSLDGLDVRLSNEIGEQPIVLIFGNFTCGPFRSQSGNIEKLYERYRDRAKFFLIYVREAHPSDGWWMESNQRVGIDLAQPLDQEQRVTVAQRCQSHLQISIPFLVDSTNDVAGTAYSGMPNRLYLIDSEGKITFKNGRGPFGFHTRELEQALIFLLNDPPAGSTE